MRVFIDTNIFISLIEDSEDSEIARSLLNTQEYELGTSLLNMLEVRTVLTKKKGRPQDSVEKIIHWLKQNLDFLVRDVPDLGRVESSQRTNLLYPMDCMIRESALREEAIPTTLDGEMKHHGCVHPKYLI